MKKIKEFCESFQTLMQSKLAEVNELLKSAGFAPGNVYNVITYDDPDDIKRLMFSSFNYVMYGRYPTINVVFFKVDSVGRNKHITKHIPLTKIASVELLIKNG